MRVGVLGGSFNPPHWGHVLVAVDVRRRFRLDRVLLLPSFRPPHKRGPLADYRHRAAMVRIAARLRPGLEPCLVEEGRPGPSYTADTLAELSRQMPGADIYFIMGADQYRDMGRWHRPRELARLARLVVMDRPAMPRPPLFPGHRRSRVLPAAVIPVAISARLVRARLARGLSVRYMLPRPVLDYVRRNGLYLS